MYQRYLILFLLTFGFCHMDLKAQGHEEVKNSSWKGYQRVDFRVDDTEVRIIFPDKPAPGNPWLWRARFPDWHTESDSLLVNEGFHLVYVNTDQRYGSPSAIKIWDKLYTFLTEHYSLSAKAALVGVSRGGLFIYNWAKKNPQKVACIYAEAPVCDFKSWPAGFGISTGSADDWQKLKEEYGFQSDEEAKVYMDNPIDNLEQLAAAKVPVLHMISLKDKIVPPEDNTLLLIKKYIQLGGSATVIPCTTGQQTLEGHHFDIETPRLVADFIKYYALSKKPLDASSYHFLRSGLKNSKIQFERYKKGRVAFLGGSITYNGGWRDSVCTYLKKHFPDTDFEFIAAGIPSMGSTPAAFRLERDVLSYGRIDLLFEEAAVNDAVNGRTSEEQVKAMEGIVRHIRMANPSTDIVMMHFVDPEKIKDYEKGKEPEVIINHNRVAEHYDIPTINLAKEVTERIRHSEFTWEDDFKNLHPSTFGQGVYAHSIIHFLEKAYSGRIDDDDKIANHNNPEKLNPYCYDNGMLMDIAKIDTPKSWEINLSWSPKDSARWRANYVNVPMLIGQSPGKILRQKFKGTAIGIAVAAGPDAGIIEYRIDKDKWQKLNLYTSWSHYIHLPWYYTLGSALTPDTHLLEIRMIPEKSDQGQERYCRIRYFYINKPVLPN